MVLIILTGVTINLTVGENGLITRAQSIAKLQKELVANEQASLSDLENGIINGGNGEESGNLPENTPTTDAGKEVQPDTKWLISAAYIVSEIGEKISNAAYGTTVYAVSDGSGNTIPVPYGFYFVGGNKDNGVVISDNQTDKNKYAGQTNVGKDLDGNQFVFIPCSIDDYKKISWGYTNASGWDTSTNTAEETQIQKYGGFYVGRYEAGTSGATFNTDVSAAVSTSNWQNACYTVANTSTESKPTTKSGEIPWFHADYNTAVTISKRMYNTNSVNSGLITGTQWDVMINWMSTLADQSDLKANSAWGNYNNTTLTDCEGKYSTVNTSNGSSSAWAENTGKTNRVSTYTLLTTGSSEIAKKKNLYDVAGNLWEWTQETAYYSSGTNYFMLRGGCFNVAYASVPVCYRSGNTASYTSTDLGFRPVLYIK